MKYPNTSSWGKETAKKRYADGGNVASLPMSVAKTADALKRLDSAGILNRSQARDFASSRLAKEGYDPAQVLGGDAKAKYNSGGKVK